MSDKYELYIHNNRSENTIGKFWRGNYILTQPNFELSGLVNFLNYKPEGSISSNIDKIFEIYPEEDKVIYEDSVRKIKNSQFFNDILDLPIYYGTTLFLLKDQKINELSEIRGKNLFLKQDNTPYFFSDKLYELLSSDGYQKVESIALEGRDLSVQIINENVQVWAWIRSLNKIINLSYFIRDLSISKSDVGNFSFVLSPIDSIDKLEFVDKDILNYFILNDGEKYKNDFWCENLQNNDIVFIRFEKLKLEEELKSSFENDLEINKASLPGRVWDMIGLIDEITVNTTFMSQSDQDISVSGRDFMKLLIEDGSYFMPIQYIQGASQGSFIGFGREDKYFKRNFVDGRFDDRYWFMNEYRSISDTIGFIINQLSNLGILDGEDLFANYGDEKRTLRYKSDNTVTTQSVVDGIWQIIHVHFDRNLNKRRMGDASISYVDSTILEQFNKICQQPFVEFFGDTYGDEFDFIVRQPPFNRDSVLSFLRGENRIKSSELSREGEIKGGTNNNFYVEITRKNPREYNIIEIKSENVGSTVLSWDSTYYSWYQLQPSDNFMGEYSFLSSGGMIPIVAFPRIANTFGNHRLVLTDNYLFSNQNVGENSEIDYDLYRESLLNDLKFIIDTNIYLPFTRKGTITLVNGDRRIKRGTWIKFLPTQEIFYVDAVSHRISFSNDRIDRTTTLQVSRGMIEEYVYGSVGYDKNGKVIEKAGEPAMFSYFDIANTSIMVRDILRYDKSGQNIINSKEEKEISSKYSVEIGVKGSIADRNNNPGNLRFANQIGAINNDGWAKFETTEKGFEALMRDIDIKKSGRSTTGLSQDSTLNDFIYVYAPPKENNTENYIEKISSYLNASKDEKLINIDTFQLAKNLIKIESNSTVVKGKDEITKSFSPEGIQDIVSSTLRESNQNLQQIESISFDKANREVKYDFGINDDQFDFFLKRNQFNIFKFKK